MKLKYRSRIKELFDDEMLKSMFLIQKKYTTKQVINGVKETVDYTPKLKGEDMTNILTRYLKTKHPEATFSFPGSGTNRMAILINGYIYKIALDNDGFMDNLNEFIISKEAQPYVTKTYETNGLIAVAEYVTLISYDEFQKYRNKILDILDDIGREYLIGDMGFTKKNFCNWGYRTCPSDLVILDYGHMHRVSPEKLICRHCGGIINYNMNYTGMRCLNCGKEDTFKNIKDRLSKKEEIDTIDKFLANVIKMEGEEKMKIIEVDDVKNQNDDTVEEDESYAMTVFNYDLNDREKVIVEDEIDYTDDETDKLDLIAAIAEGKTKLNFKSNKHDEPEEDKYAIKYTDFEIYMMSIDEDERRLELNDKFISGELTYDEVDYYLNLKFVEEKEKEIATLKANDEIARHNKEIEAKESEVIEEEDEDIACISSFIKTKESTKSSGIVDSEFVEREENSFIQSLRDNDDDFFGDFPDSEDDDDLDKTINEYTSEHATDYIYSEILKSIKGDDTNKDSHDDISQDVESVVDECPVDDNAVAENIKHVNEIERDVELTHEELKALSFVENEAMPTPELPVEEQEYLEKCNDVESSVKEIFDKPEEKTSDVVSVDTEECTTIETENLEEVPYTEECEEIDNLYKDYGYDIDESSFKKIRR